MHLTRLGSARRSSRIWPTDRARSGCVICDRPAPHVTLWNRQHMELAHLTWQEVDSLNRDLPVIIPVAALEQHGRHMPVFTDSMLLGEIVRRAHAAFNRSANKKIDEAVIT